MQKTILQALPLHLIDVDSGILIKRGNSILHVNGTGAQNAVRTVLAALGPTGATEEEVIQKFTGPDRKAAKQLIEKLVANRFVVAHDFQATELGHESHLDIFYWHFGESAKSVAERLNKQRITILGLNSISRQLCATLSASGFENIEIVDCPTLRNIQLFPTCSEESLTHWTPLLGRRPRNFEEWKATAQATDLDCLIATSDFGGPHLFKEWNRFCVQHKRFFFPILLQDQVGLIGPLVVPDQTACFECFVARHHSHRPPTPSSKQIDETAHDAQAVVGFHPAMASALADIAAFELTKFFSGVVPGWNVGTVLEMNLLTSRMTPRKVLKVPRCPVCSPLITRPPTNPKKSFSVHPITEKA